MITHRTVWIILVPLIGFSFVMTTFADEIILSGSSNESEMKGSKEDFIVGNSLFILLHKFGHMLIRDFDIPILGLEENSVDTLASIALIREDQQRPDREPRFIQLLGQYRAG